MYEYTLCIQKRVWGGCAPSHSDLPRTTTTTETKRAKNKDLTSPLPWTISDHSSRDLWMDMMPRPPKEILMSTKSKSPALLDFERLMRVEFER